MKKINVGILFGGKSAEHEVSLQSAKNVYDAIDKKKYNPVLIGIDKTGKWLSNGRSQFLLNSDNPKTIKLNSDSCPVALVPQSGGKISNLSDDTGNIPEKLDVIFPILHGPFGEDGTVQGLIKLANLPFVGSGVLGSAVGMDKDIMKRLLRDAEIPIAKYIALKSSNKILSFSEIKEKIGMPCFIKPANLGSSVGVNKVSDKTGYKRALQEAFKYDTKILIEELVKAREIECAVLGNEKPIASIPGEVISKHEFYSYEAKYIDENGASLEIPAKLEKNTVKKIQELAVKTFITLSCEGMGRVDFFLKDNNEVIVNEINTIPGFTKISMYPRLWEHSGIPYPKLIDRLINLAIERFEKEAKLKTSYDL